MAKLTSEIEENFIDCLKNFNWANKELAKLLNIKEGDKIGDEKWFYWTFNKYIKLQYFYDKIDQFLDSYFLELHM